MSASNQAVGPSTDNFTAIFSAASDKYLRVTGKRLDTHPFAAQLDTCHNPEAVSNLLRTQAHAFSKFHKGDEKLMAWLNPTVNILFAFSGTLGEGIGLVSRIIHSVRLFLMTWFSAILTRKDDLYWYWCSSRGGSLLRSQSHIRLRPNFQVVRDVVASHEKIIHLFERINFFLQRLNIYTGIPLTNDLTVLLGKIMAELLSILAISTKAMTDRKMSELIYSLPPFLADYGLRKVSEEACRKDGG
jgi:hypothetical protein